MGKRGGQPCPRVPARRGKNPLPYPLTLRAWSRYGIWMRVRQHLVLQLTAGCLPHRNEWKDEPQDCPTTMANVCSKVPGHIRRAGGFIETNFNDKMSYESVRGYQPIRMARWAERQCTLELNGLTQLIVPSGKTKSKVVQRPGPIQVT